MTAPASTLTGQQSLERLCAGHPAALARLKELIRNTERYRLVRNLLAYEDVERLVAEGNPCPDETESVQTDFAVDKAIAEGGR